MSRVADIKNWLSNQALDVRFEEIIRGSVFSFGGRAAGLGVGFVTSVLIARLYGADLLGTVAVIDAFFLLSASVGTLGLDHAIVRIVSEKLATRTVDDAFQRFALAVSVTSGVSLCLTAVLVGTATLWRPFFENERLPGLLLLAGAFLVFKALGFLAIETSRALRLIGAFAVLQALPQASMLILLGVIGVVWGGRETPIVAQLLSTVVVAAIALVVVWKGFRARGARLARDGAVGWAAELLQLSTPMMITAWLQMVVAQSAVLILGYFRPESEVGYFSVAVRVAALLGLVLHAVNSMAGPRFAELWQKRDDDELIEIAQGTAKIAFWASLPLLVGLAALGLPFLRIVFGPEFAAAYVPMLVLLAAQVGNVVCGSTGLFMNMTGGQIALRNGVGVGAIVTVVGTIALAPPLGVLGAAAGAGAGLVTWNVLVLVHIRQRFGRGIGYVPFASWIRARRP